MQRAVVPVLASFTILAGAVALGGLSPAAADKGGCPSQAAANAVTHANSNSAHGSVKQEARDCSTVVPTPTPTPADEADVRVEGVSVTAPDTASVGDSFSVFVGVSLSNDGPADKVTVDTTVELTVPFGCSLSSPSLNTVEDTPLEKGQGVFIGIGWSVTCSQSGTFTFTANATADIDPVLSKASDPDLGNNSGVGSDTTGIYS